MRSTPGYAFLERAARHYCRRADEWEDLLQDSLLEAWSQGRSDVDNLATLRWVKGIIRNKALEQARSAFRRHERERRAHHVHLSQACHPLDSDAYAPAPVLTPALTILYKMALSGYSRQEIGWLLQLPDTALRQRLRSLRARLQHPCADMNRAAHSLRYPLKYGIIRQRLLNPVRQLNVYTGTHDPDGHLLMFFSSPRSQFMDQRQPVREVPTHTKEPRP